MRARELSDSVARAALDMPNTDSDAVMMVQNKGKGQVKGQVCVDTA